MAIKKRYIIDAGADEDAPGGTIEIEHQFSQEHGDMIEFVVRQSTPPAAPDEVRFWLTRAQAFEVTAATHASLGVVLSREEAVILGFDD